ncbi:hypothetical protein D7V86_25170 [bacterium D16-51]|nr:hypothetical protein D7V96_25800 [bacterium D16-59]RKI53338.1 hypothetical protein D7V86_25170 [bacterium D16-51]
MQCYNLTAKKNYNQLAVTTLPTATQSPRTVHGGFCYPIYKCPAFQRNGILYGADYAFPM